MDSCNAIDTGSGRYVFNQLAYLISVITDYIIHTLVIYYENM